MKVRWSVAFSPDGKTIAAGYSDGVFSVRTSGGMVLTGPKHAQTPHGLSARYEQGFVASVAFSPDGKTIAAGIGVALSRRWGCGAVGRAGHKLLPT